MADVQASALEFVNPELTEEEHDAAFAEILNAVKHARVTVPQLVGALLEQLTTEDNAIRSRACQLLAAVVKGMGDAPLEDTAIHSLSAFFASRLEDFPSLRGALTGALALLKRPPELGSLHPDDILAVARAVFSHVHVQSLTAVDRMLAYEVLEILIASHPAAVQALGGNFLDGLVAAIDGEKDPRCLLLAFQLVEIVPRVFQTRGGEKLLQEAAEELFELIAVYFPVSFSPPPNDTRGITREDLVLALERALAATALFAPYSLPLFIEKLASSLTSAKLDSLHALKACAQSYGSAIRPQTGPLWSALRAELLPQSVEAASAGDVGPVPERSAAVETAAAEALTQCVRALGSVTGVTPVVSNRLVDLVLGDPSLDDLFSAAKGERTFPLSSLLDDSSNLSHEPKASEESTSGVRASATSHYPFSDLAQQGDDETVARKEDSVGRWARVLSAVASADMTSANRITEALLARVTSIGVLGYTAMRLFSEVARAAGSLAKERHSGVSQGGETGELLDARQFLGGKAEVLGRIFSGVVKSWGAQTMTSEKDLEELATLAVNGLEALASVPPPSSATEPTPLLRNSVSVLVDALFVPPLETHSAQAPQQRALQALASISRGVLATDELSLQLKKTNDQATRGRSDGWLGAKQVWTVVSERFSPDFVPGEFTLQVLATLAESSGYINRAVLETLRLTVGKLWASVHAGGDYDNESGAEKVLQLLAREILPRFGPDPSDQDSVLLFVHELLTHLATWPSPGRPNDGLLGASLGALSVAVRVCTEANQAAVFRTSEAGFFEALREGQVWRTGPVLAILVGLRPNVSAQAGNTRSLQGLLSLALQTSDALIAETASIALASVLNKWSTSTFQSAAAQEASFSHLLRGGLQSAERTGGEAGPPTAEALSPQSASQSRPVDTSPVGASLPQTVPNAAVSTPPPAASRVTSSPPVTPAPNQTLPPVTPPGSAASSNYSPAVFFNSSPQSVLAQSTPASILEPAGFSPAGGQIGPSPDPPRVASAPLAPSFGEIPIGRRRVAQRLDMSPLGAPNPAAMTPSLEAQPSEPRRGSPEASVLENERLNLDDALTSVLDGSLLPRAVGESRKQDGAASGARIQGLRVLGHVGQGLAMRGHKRTEDIVGALIKLLFDLGWETARVKVDAGSFSREAANQGSSDRVHRRDKVVPGVSSSTLASFETAVEESASGSKAAEMDLNEEPGQDVTKNRLRGGYEDLCQLAGEAAAFFGVVTGERRVSFETSASLQLSKETHAQIKPLYRQRLFMTSLGPFSEAIRRARNPEERLPLYRGLAYLLKGTPSAALALEAEKVLLLLLESLSALSASHPPSNARETAPPSDAPLVLSNLLTLTSFLVDRSSVREQASEHVPSIVRTLVQLTSYKASVGVRETALQALVAAADLPFTRVYPLRNEVQKAILGALDDPKRAVRKEAVRCKRVWNALGSLKR